MKEARRKQLTRDLKELQISNLATHGGEKFMAKQNELLDSLAILEGKDRQTERWVDNWAILEAKGGQ